MYKIEGIEERGTTRVVTDSSAGLNGPRVRTSRGLAAARQRLYLDRDCITGSNIEIRYRPTAGKCELITPNTGRAPYRARRVKSANRPLFSMEVSLLRVVCPSWSRDGRRVYFASRRSGKYEVWKVQLDGGEPVQVTRNGGHVALESVDGKSVYYTKYSLPDTSLWKAPVAGGAEAEVLPSRWGRRSACSRPRCFAAHALDHPHANQGGHFHRLPPRQLLDQALG